LISTMLQNMFPTLNVQTVKLSLIKRCTLWSYNRDTCSIDFRHYGIRVVPRGMSRGVRKITQSKIPNLSKYEDISEYILGLVCV
jgi:ribosome biogenesis protein SSF1/2